jgi:pyruvate kinase
MQRRTKIVVTLGPACDDPAVLDQLVDAGMDVARLGFAHGDIDVHRHRIKQVREAAARRGRRIGILADLPGPKIRTKGFPASGVELVKGATLEIRCDVSQSSATVLGVDEPDVVACLAMGDLVRMGDGSVELEVIGRRGEVVDAVVQFGGTVRGRPGLHVPSDRVHLRTPTEEDAEYWRGIADLGVDFVAISMVRSRADIEAAQEMLGHDRPMIVAKLETAAAIKSLGEIVATADAVMVARGDLGSDVAIEMVPHLQKHIIRTCVEAGVPVITATQMLESMVSAPTPTRAEASDVANSVFDGTDAVMLSGETAIGRDPVRVVETMSKIVVAAEAEADYLAWGGRVARSVRMSGSGDSPDDITKAMAHAAWQASLGVGLKAIICSTQEGRTTRALSRFRPTARLIGASPNQKTLGQLTLSWGVRPLAVDHYRTTDDLVWCVTEAALAAGEISHGDLFAILARSPQEPAAPTDVLRIIKVR